MKIVFLYTELAGYFLACVSALARRGAEVHIVRWPVNKEAPFQFEFPPGAKVYERNDYSREGLIQLVESIGPSLIFSSGWMDKNYVAVCRKFKKRIPVIVGFDNQWKGTMKQRVAAMLSPFLIHRNFTHCMVPGELQVAFAEKLGFSKDKILTGYYSADFDLFYSQYVRNLPLKQKQFPHRFIYVGRYYSFKGITDLWEAFSELQNEAPNDWELWCLGIGDLEPFDHPSIKHFGFVQPADMPEYIRETGVFVLPSRFEPWGVVVHEFAASGFPIVCTDEVGARVAFAGHGHNGYIYKAGDKETLKRYLRKLMASTDEELLAMGERSVEKAREITPAKWAASIMSVAEKNKD